MSRADPNKGPVWMCLVTPSILSNQFTNPLAKLPSSYTVKNLLSASQQIKSHWIQNINSWQEEKDEPAWGKTELKHREIQNRHKGFWLALGASKDTLRWESGLDSWSRWVLASQALWELHLQALYFPSCGKMLARLSVSRGSNDGSCFSSKDLVVRF